MSRATAGKKNAAELGGSRKPEPYHHGNLRRALLDVSLDLIEREGAAALSLREVARRAGVTHAAPYRHFTDKEALLAAVAEEGHRLLLAGMDQSLEGIELEAAADRIVAVGVAYVSFAVAHPSYFRVMFGPELTEGDRHPSLRTASEASFDLLVSVVDDAKGQGWLRSGQSFPLALSIWCQVHGLAHLLVDGRLVRKGLAAEQAPVLAAAQVRELIRALAPDDRLAARTS